MDKILAVVVFYAVATLVVYLLNKVGRDAPDGGPGLGSLALLLFVLAAFVWMLVSVYQGFRFDKSYFLASLIHLVVLSVVFRRFYG